MRVLFVSHSFPPPDRPLANVGGMQRVATELHEALGSHPGVELSSLILRSSWSSTHLKTPGFLARSVREIRRMAARGEVDVVLFSSMVTAALAVPLRRTLHRHGVLTAAIVHGRDVTLDVAAYQWFVPRVFGALDLVLPVSRATGAACLERGLDASRCSVVPNGIQVERFAPGDEDAAARRRLVAALGDPVRPLPDGALLLCSVGRQVKRKGFAWFVEEVMPLLPGNVHYWLAGDGPESETIEAAAKRQGLGTRVRLLGRVSEEELAQLYRGADLFVMPNIPVPGDMEGFGVVMLEAGLCGLPALAARLEGITDVIAEGENGHLLESGHAWAFSEWICRYEEDRERLRAASSRARSYVERTFSWDAVADQYVRTLAELRAGVDEPEETTA